MKVNDCKISLPLAKTNVKLLFTKKMLVCEWVMFCKYSTSSHCTAVFCHCQTTTALSDTLDRLALNRHNRYNISFKWFLLSFFK